MVESKPVVNDVAKSPELYFWIANNDNYAHLRKIKDCSTLNDLDATPRDCRWILKFARKLRVPMENIIREVNPTKKELDDSFKFLMKKSVELTR